MLAVCCDRYGWTVSDEELSDWCDRWEDGEQDDDGPDEIAVVTGSALPVDGKLPGSHRTLDEIALWRIDDAEPDEIRQRWAMAKRIAAALNAQEPA